MTVTQARGAANKAKKHQPILQAAHTLMPTSQTNKPPRFDDRFLHLHVGPQRCSFSAHEDVLCKQSTFFKNRLQQVCKDTEGECVLCNEDMHALTARLTYCKTCGNNLHRKSLREWRNTNNTCPTCRAEWVTSPIFRSVVIIDVDPDGFETYLQWLYQRTIPTYAMDNGNDELRCFKLIDAHVVGEFLEDKEFVQVVRQEIINCSLQMDEMAHHKILLHVYGKTIGSCALRRFIIDLYVLRGSYELLDKLETTSTIFRDIMRSMMEKAKTQDVKAVWDCMISAGHIEQDEMSPSEGGETGNQDLRD